MVNTELLRDIMRKKHASIIFLSQSLGVTAPTFYAKMNKSTFKKPEIECISTILQLSPGEKEKIFFS